MIGLHWLASSERERQQAFELARAFQQKESRDELGIGTVRDALADLLFPGTSTLHTRARYHLFIPWAYQHAAAHGGSGALAARVRAAEVQLIGALKDAGDTRGLIGRDAGAALKRMPSALYWQGLQVWGIRRVGGPQSVVERLMTRSHRQPVRDDDDEVLDAAVGAVWHPNLPSAPVNHPYGATFPLTFNESDFLAERLRMEPETRESALAQLVDIQADHEAVDWAWEHPALACLSARNLAAIEQGRRFSLLMHGALWLYNVVLAHMLGSTELEDAHRDEFREWADRADGAGDVLVAWDLEELWDITGARVPVRARLFARRWQEVARTHGFHALVDRADARALIIDRERAMKGSNARTVNSKALNQWGGASATAALDFRWTTARLLIADVRRGLELADAQD
jgi:hypothetical protein